MVERKPMSAVPFAFVADLRCGVNCEAGDCGDLEHNAIVKTKKGALFPSPVLFTSVSSVLREQFASQRQQAGLRWPFIRFGGVIYVCARVCVYVCVCVT